MAEQTEGTKVIKIALAAAFGDGNDVIGIPKRSARRDGTHAKDAQTFLPGGAACAFEGGEDGQGIGIADRTAALVAGEDLIAQIAGIGAETPLVDAELRAEGAPAPGQDLKIAPAAERQSIGPAARVRVAMCPAGLGQGS